MRHLKRHIAPAFVAAALLAAALPGVASASSLESNGSLVPAGKIVKLVSTYANERFLFTSSLFGEEPCQAELRTKVAKNGLYEGLTQFELASLGETSYMRLCPFGGNPGQYWTTGEVKINKIQSSKTGSGVLSIELTMSAPHWACKLSSPAGGNPFTYVPGGNTISIKPSPLNVTGAGCKTWALGENTLALTYTDKTPIILR